MDIINEVKQAAEKKQADAFIHKRVEDGIKMLHRGKP
jgi:hypothetical protein